ncbi:50S ribosome-binding protein YggL [Oceanimonas marisflavi]|uniref:50S ribosome-binding protein YggL n=1 Tax=Oceanimonas marisflavi TaxID=2059724 RepID=UPI0038CDAA7F
MKTKTMHADDPRQHGKRRSRRLRKKLRVDEFQELGFSLTWGGLSLCPAFG